MYCTIKGKLFFEGYPFFPDILHTNIIIYTNDLPHNTGFRFGK